jgi:hypothetical protein
MAMLLKVLPFDVLVTVSGATNRLLTVPGPLRVILFVNTEAAAPANARDVVTPFTVCKTDTLVSMCPTPLAEYNRVNVQVCKLPRVAPLQVSDVME